MKIGLVLSQVPGYSETFFRSKIKLLQASGHKVFVFSENPKKINVEGATVVETPQLSKSFSLVVALNFIKALLTCMFIIPLRSIFFVKNERDENVSWVKAFSNLLANNHILRFNLDWLHFGFATMALRRENIGQTIKARVAVSFRGYDIAIYPVKNPGCYSLLWRKLDKVHTISDDLLQIAYNNGLPRNIPVEKITPAIDTAFFYNSSRTGKLNRKVKILSVGRLHWKKGYEYAFRALLMLKERSGDFEFTIIGEGKDYERLCFSAWQLGLSDNITFAGKLSHNEMPGFMEKFDVYIQPSVQEGFCNSVLEAQCNGLFCIVSDAEGLAENVINGKTGIVIPKRSPESLVNAFEQYISMTEEERLRIIKNAQNRVLELFSLENQMQKFNAFYKI